MKKILMILVLVAAAGWAIWYFGFREKTLGEKVDDAAQKVEKSLDNAAKKLSR
jgi:hypothetical protein